MNISMVVDAYILLEKSLKETAHLVPIGHPSSIRPVISQPVPVSRPVAIPVSNIGIPKPVSIPAPKPVQVLPKPVNSGNQLQYPSIQSIHSPV